MKVNAIDGVPTARYAPQMAPDFNPLPPEPEWLSTSELGVRWRVTAEEIEQFVREGLPSDQAGPGSPVRFRTADAGYWLSERSRRLNAEIKRICPACRGRGTVRASECGVCTGTGRLSCEAADKWLAARRREREQRLPNTKAG